MQTLPLLIRIFISMLVVVISFMLIVAGMFPMVSDNGVQIDPVATWVRVLFVALSILILPLVIYICVPSLFKRKTHINEFDKSSSVLRLNKEMSLRFWGRLKNYMNNKVSCFYFVCFVLTFVYGLYFSIHHRLITDGSVWTLMFFVTSFAWLVVISKYWFAIKASKVLFIASMIMLILMPVQYSFGFGYRFPGLIFLPLYYSVMAIIVVRSKA